MSDWWKPKDYDAAVKENAKNPDPDLAAAIQTYQAKHNQSSVEERGAQQGFISQQFPASGMPNVPAMQEGFTPEKPSEPSGAVGEISPIVPPRDEKLMAEARATDPSLRSASKRKILYAPPEALAPPDQGMTWDPSPLKDFMRYMPSWVGGGTEMWHEPSLADFRSQAGDKAKGLDKSSQEYKDYADAAWLDRYNRAHQNGENVVRIAYATDDMVSKIALETPDVGTSAMLGASDSIAPGLLTEALPWLAEATGAAPPGARERVHATMDESPMAAGLGSIAGAPFGVAGAIGKGASAATGLTKELAAGVPSAGRAVLKGAGAGALTAAGMEGAHEAAAAATGNGEDAPDVLRKLLLAWLGGGIFGGLAGGGAAFSEGLRDPNTEAGAQLMFMDEAQGTDSGKFFGLKLKDEPQFATRPWPFNPVKMSPEAKAATQLSKVKGSDDYGRRPYDIMAGQVAPRIEAAQAAEDAALEQAIIAKNQQYYEKPVAQKQIQGRSVASAVKDTLMRLTKPIRDFASRPMDTPESRAVTLDLGTKNSDAMAANAEARAASGDVITGNAATLPKIGAAEAAREPLMGANLGVYRELYNHTHDFIPDTGLGLDVQRIALREGGNIITAKQAREFGAQLPFDVPDSARVVEIPKQMNARQYDQAVHNVDQLAKADAKTGASDRELGYFQKAIREDRANFEGLNELHAASNAQLEQLQSRSRLAGIPQGDNVPTAERVEGIKQNVQNFRQPGRGSQDAALLSFADAGPLYQIAAARGASSIGHPGLGRSGIVERGKLTVDPAARAAAKYGLPAAAAFGGPAASAAADLASTTKEVGKNLGRKTKRFLTEDEEKRP